jgi:hypothetical protein
MPPRTHGHRGVNMRKLSIVFILCLVSTLAWASSIQKFHAMVVARKNVAAGSYLDETAVYRFESGALTIDSSGNGHTLTENGDPTADGVNYQEGSYSVALDGVGDYCSSDSTDFDIGTNDYIIAGWFRVGSVVGQSLIQKWAAYNNGWWIGIAGSDPYYFAFSNYAAWSGQDTSTAFEPAANTWYHFIIFFDTDAENEITVWVSSTSAFGDQINGTQYNCNYNPAASGTDMVIGDTSKAQNFDDVRIIVGADLSAFNATMAEALWDGSWAP